MQALFKCQSMQSKFYFSFCFQNTRYPSFLSSPFLVDSAQWRKTNYLTNKCFAHFAFSDSVCKRFTISCYERVEVVVVFATPNESSIQTQLKLCSLSNVLQYQSHYLETMWFIPFTLVIKIKLSRLWSSLVFQNHIKETRPLVKCSVSVQDFSATGPRTEQQHSHFVSTLRFGCIQ